MNSPRKQNEIHHGLRLSQGNPIETWGWSTPAGILRARRRAELIALHARFVPGMRVLELGCGTGLFTEQWRSWGVHITALDISPELLTIAQRRATLADGVQFIQGAFEESEFPKPFDAIIGSSVLHHLSLPKALKKIFHILKSGGIMSFAEPNFLNPQVFLERMFRFLPMFTYISPDETAFVRQKLARKLKSIGFQQISITPFDWLHPALPPALIPMLKRLEGHLERSRLIREFSGSLIISAQKP